MSEKIKVFPHLHMALAWLRNHPGYEIAKSRGGHLVWVRSKK